MRLRHHQNGASALAVLVIVGLFSFFLMCGMRLLPAYMDGMSVRGVLEGLAENKALVAQPLSETRKRLQGSYLTNQIEVINVKDVIIKRDKGNIMVDASYESRVHLFSNIDAVVVFDDLQVVISK